MDTSVQKIGTWSRPTEGSVREVATFTQNAFIVVGVGGLAALLVLAGEIASTAVLYLDNATCLFSKSVMNRQDCLFWHFVVVIRKIKCLEGDNRIDFKNNLVWEFVLIASG